MISTRSVGLVIDTFVCLTLAKWETVSGPFGGYLIEPNCLTCSIATTSIGVIGHMVVRKPTSPSAASVYPRTTIGAQQLARLLGCPQFLNISYRGLQRTNDPSLYQLVESDGNHNTQNGKQ